MDEHDCLAVPPGNPSYKLRRVWLTPEQEEGYYYGFANEGLWPLCHIAFKRPVFRKANWESYQEVNRLFAKAVIEEAGQEPAIIFIQDYHFCLLPHMLKEMGHEKLIVAQFWHIPWPNPEMFRACPWSQELVEGLLGNDLLGFHIQNHCQNFFETVDRSLEAMLDRESWQITRGGHVTRVCPFPISIDFEAATALSTSAEVHAAMEKWRRKLRLGDRLLGVGIERLDYTKGIPERLRALGVNPFAIEETAQAIHQALTMEPEERERRMKAMREKVAYNNVYRWAGSILSRLMKLDIPEAP